MKNILCKLGFHDYEINQQVTFKGKFINYIRVCQRCNKKQSLQRPKEYHPSAYVWRDIK